MGWGGVGGEEFWFSSKYYEMQSTNCFFFSFLLSFLKGVINGPHGAPYLHQNFWPHRFGYGETIIILHPPIISSSRSERTEPRNRKIDGKYDRTQKRAKTKEKKKKKKKVENLAQHRLGWGQIGK